MRQTTLDKITTATGIGATIAGTLAGYGVSPQITVPIAGILGSIFSWFTQKPATAVQPAQTNYVAPYQPPGGSNG